jgi:hypothetical protein
MSYRDAILTGKAGRVSCHLSGEICYMCRYTSCGSLHENFKAPLSFCGKDKKKSEVIFPFWGKHQKKLK